MPAVMDGGRQRCALDTALGHYAEAVRLRHGAEKSAHRQRNHERLDIFLAKLRCVDFDAGAAAIYGRIRTALERRDHIIGPYDLQIVAHALTLGLVLVSDNVREFRRVRGLRVENWRRG